MISNFIKMTNKSKVKSKQLVDDMRLAKRIRKQERELKRTNKYSSIDECLN